jgi:hypothetical protein
VSDNEHVCATCQWWQYVIPQRRLSVVPALCCGLTRHHDVEGRAGHDHRDSRAKAWGRKGEAYWLETAPTFGCNQWEAREQPDPPGDT